VGGSTDGAERGGGMGGATGTTLKVEVATGTTAYVGNVGEVGEVDQTRGGAIGATCGLAEAAGGLCDESRVG